MGSVHPKLPQALLANDNRESAVARVPADGSGVRLDCAALGAFFLLCRAARYGTPLAPVLGFAALSANLPRRVGWADAGFIAAKAVHMAKLVLRLPRRARSGVGLRCARRQPAKAA